jgi:hypothetical protein
LVFSKKLLQQRLLAKLQESSANWRPFVNAAKRHHKLPDIRSESLTIDVTIPSSLAASRDR